jgi:hypothetical protein
MIKSAKAPSGVNSSVNKRPSSKILRMAKVPVTGSLFAVIALWNWVWGIEDKT